MNWISVEERLPKDSDEYLICYGDQAVSSADFNANTNEWFTVRSFGQDCEERPLYCVTHWMSMPDPPS